MKVHFLLVGMLAFVLQVSAPDSMAHGGGGGSGGGHGGGRGMFHGGGRLGGGFHGHGRFAGGFHGHGRHFVHGRFFGPGVGFYGFGYPWWGYGYGYPYYSSYYGYDYYDNSDYGDQYDRNPRYLSPRAVQTALAWRGYYSGRIDGIMGPETSNAIRSFQSQRGLPVTGQIDGRLINALQR